MNSNADIVVIGAGAVGLSTAWKLLCKEPSLKIIVLEKEPSVSAHQTGHNSGVIHSGIYYKPGSAKARNCIAGREELVQFCQEHSVAHEVCGKVIVAAEEWELSGLEKIYQTGLQNGLEQIRKISTTELKEIEPHCFGIAALWVPYTGIVDFPGVCRTLARLITEKGGEIRLQEGLIALKKNQNNYELQTSRSNSIQTRYLISCAGLQSDRIAKMDGKNPQMRIVGFRGDYYDLTKEAEHKVRNLIYPVPNPAFPFLGVHFTRMALGGVECGPNAVFTFKREGYGKTDFDWTDTIEALSYSGTWKLFWKHWRFGWNEYRRAFSKELFLKQLQRLLPSLQLADLVPGRSGVRAMALAPDGSMIDDFYFETDERSIHVLNAPSPAATACLSIGNTVADLALEKMT